MDFNLTMDQQALVSEAREFAQENLVSSDRAGALVADYGAAWVACSKAWYAGLPLAQEYGGRGLSLTDSMLIFEAMAATGADPGFLFSLGVHQFAAAISVATIGTDAQKDMWLGAMAAGTCVGALAVSERDAGSDSYAMVARARETGDGFQLSGKKIWITNAPVADLFLVCARSDDAPGAFGISCFLVPKDTRGVRIEKGPTKSGIRGAPWGSVKLDDVAVSADAMLGGRGGGAAVFRESMRWERCGLYAIALGAMQRSLADGIAHVRTRNQFGSPLVDNAIVSKTIAQMKTRHEAARLLLYKAAATIDDGNADDALVSLAKAYVSEAAVANGLAAQELYGALGVLEDSAAARFLNDVLPFRVLSGPTDVQYRIATRLLLRATKQNE